MIAVDELAGLGVELGQLGSESLQLALAHVLGQLAKRGDERSDLAGRALGAVALDLGREDRAHLADLAPASLRGTLRVLLQIVEVEERDVGDVADAGIDVARQGHVDHEQRLAVAARHHHLDHGPLDEHFRRRGRRQQHVGVDEHVGDIGYGDGLGADVGREVLRARERSIRDDDVGDTSRRATSKRGPNPSGPRRSPGHARRRGHRGTRLATATAADGIETGCREMPVSVRTRLPDSTACLNIRDRSWGAVCSRTAACQASRT